MTVEVPEPPLGETPPAQPLLSSIAVEELFGRYTYTIDVPTDADGNPSRLVLLYGENGSGKTTLLQMLWHLLSPAETRGHRTYLVRVPFKVFSVRFTDGSELRVTKSSGLVGSYQVLLRRPENDDVTVRFEANADQELITKRNRSALWARQLSASFQTHPERPPASTATSGTTTSIADLQANDAAEQEYLAFLAATRSAPLFLSDDRSFHWDQSDPDDTLASREVWHLLDRDHGAPSASALVERELQQRIGDVNEWLRALALSGQSVGSASANTIYMDMLRKLAPTSSDTSHTVSDAGAAANSMQQLLAELSRQAPRFEDFGLAPHFAADEFVQLLDDVPPDRHHLAPEILTPYLDSLRARYKALEPVEHMVRGVLTILNRFLVDKRATFSDPASGLRIITADGAELQPGSLSSGERQLMMLLCTTVLARRDSRIFIIDEPELSLGVPWQRAILSALLSLTDGTSLQFIVATHSVEIITAERPHLAPLENTKGRSND